MVRRYQPGAPQDDIYSARDLTLSANDKANMAIAAFGMLNEAFTSREIEETERLRIKTESDERIKKAAALMEQLREAMQDQAKSDQDYRDQVFSLAHSMLDKGYPEHSVEIYKLFISDDRKPIMQHLIEYHEKISLGFIKVKQTRGL